MVSALASRETLDGIAAAGLVPWLVDVDPYSWMFDPGHLRERLPEAPGPLEAIVPCCAFGRAPDLQAWAAFRAEYLDRETPLRLDSVHTSSAAGEKDALTVGVFVDDQLRSLEGVGNGPLSAFCDALNGLPQGYDVRVLDYSEHALSAGGDAIAAAYVECAVGDQVVWGVGLDANIVTASLKAVISAVNRVG